MKHKLTITLAVAAGFSMCIGKAQTGKGKTIATKKSTVTTVKSTAKKSTGTSTVAYVLKTAKDSLSYALGTDIARSLKSGGFDLDTKVLYEGLSAAYKGSTIILSDEKSSEVIQNAVTRAREQKNAELRKPGEEFLAKNKLKPNIKSTPEGVQYEILVQGQGAQPTSSDEVKVHYLGTLPDGEKFDSSYDRNEPLTLSLQSVIQGWKIGIPLMRVGSKFKFYIPYNLAYGERGSGPKIPPFSPLIFEVELLEVKGKEGV